MTVTDAECGFKYLLSVILSKDSYNFHRNIAYAAITQGFKNLIPQLLCEPEMILQIWKQEINVLAISKNYAESTGIFP